MNVPTKEQLELMSDRAGEAVARGARGARSGLTDRQLALVREAQAEFEAELASTAREGVRAAG